MSVSSVLGSSASVPNEKFLAHIRRARGKSGSKRRRRNRKHPQALSASALLLSTTLGIILGIMGGCQGLPGNVANCPIVPAAPANLNVIPPAQEPPPKALCGFPLKVSAPADGATATSPVPLAALATAPDPIYYLRVYVDDLAVLYSFSATVNQFLWMPNGPHKVEVVAEDVAGYIATNTFHVTVTDQQPGIDHIQNLPNWLSCSAVIIAGSTCAAGLGNAVSSLTHDQGEPSMDGSSSRFTLAGKTPYSNELYWIPLGGGKNATHFSFDLWFYIDTGPAPQALEFDVNQAFGGTRWTWGSECDFDQTHVWNIWDPLNDVWRPTSIPCNHFPSNTWIHLVWTLERVGNQVHYISLNVADTTYDVDTYYTAQPKWYQEEIDIAFQMDGNWEQQPYKVWLDEVKLNGS